MKAKSEIINVAIALGLSLALCGAVYGLGHTPRPQSAQQAPRIAPPVQAPSTPDTRPNPQDYLVARQDILNITLTEQPDASGKYSVDTDGNITFPMIGRMAAAGLTVHQVERELRRLLSDGLFKDPHVSVTLDQFRGRRVFVFGGVSSPGMYPLTDGMTLLEALVKSGYGAASEAVVVRSPGASGPTMPADAQPGEVNRVNLRELEKDVEEGVLSRNMFLQDGDTVYVPRVDRNRVFVTGEVKNPGAYSVPEGTTVLQLLSLAGGVTESASTGRVKITRIVDSKKQTVKVTLDDTVLPGDTVVVPQRIF